MSPPRIFGWIPSRSEGDVVDVPPHLASGQFTYKLEHNTPPLPSATLPPSVGILTPAKGSPSAGIPASAPHKVPRPPNSFIIFRTEYARLHRNRNSRARRESIKDLTRSLSGKAADAWRSLSPKQRQHYQHLAELAKEKHALEFPDYQYRPRRREGPARPTISAPKTARTPLSLTISTARHPSSPLGADSFGVDPNALSPVEEPPPSPEAERISVCVKSCTAKANRRRSSSVPVTNGEHLYFSALCALEPGCKRSERPSERWERPAETKRRSRSVTQEWATLLPSYQIPEPIFFDPRSPQNADFSSSALYPLSFRPLSPKRYLNPAALFTSPQHMSPLAAIASSLAGWNGAQTPGPSTSPSLPIPPRAPQPVRLNPPSWLGNPDVLLGDEPPAVPESDPISAGSPPLLDSEPLPGDFSWALEPPLDYHFDVSDEKDASDSEPLPDDFSWALEPPLDYLFDVSDGKDASDLEDYARAEALREYEFGLQERVYNVGPADAGLFGLDTAAELQF